MDNLLIKDTMEVFAIDNSNTANVFFLGINTKANFVQKLSNTILRGGIGNLSKSILQTAKDATYEVSPLLWSDSLIGMLSGTTASSGSATVKYFEKDLVVSAGKVTLTGTPSGTTCDLFDANNKHYTGTISTGVVTITPTAPPDGTILTAVYDTSVTGDITNLDAASFPKSFKLYSHTVAYNPNTNAIVSDIYLVLTNAVPTGDLNAAFEAGKESTLPITFQILTPVNSTSFGSYINVPRP